MIDKKLTFNKIVCVLCGETIPLMETGEPFLLFKDNTVCYSCYISLIPEIYKMAGVGDGGIIHLHFKFLLQSEHNRKHRSLIPNYKKILDQLLHKYKFKCARCDSIKNLTIDHIHPVSKGGCHKFSNLQILCKPCNSKKGNKIENG